MVAVHAGDEYSHLPSAQQVAVFHALARSPYVDLVYGHHSHVVEPVRRVEGTWVVYGLGNMVAEQETAIPDTYRGVIAHVVFVQRPGGTYRAERPTYTPTVITDPKPTGRRGSSTPPPAQAPGAGEGRPALPPSRSGRSGPLTDRWREVRWSRVW